MSELFTNFAFGTLSQSAAIADTTIYVPSADAALLPTLGAGDFCRIVIYDNSQDPEIVKVTAKSGGTLTVERAQEGTSAKDWTAGTAWKHGPTAAGFQQAANAVSGPLRTGTATGTDAYEVTINASYTIPDFTNGEPLEFTIPNTNTGAVTVRTTNGTNTTAYKAVRLADGTALVAGDFTAGFRAKMTYDATAGYYRLSSPTSWQAYISSTNNGPVAGLRQMTQNGRLRFWLSGTSFSSPASGTETADGWFPVYDGSIGTFSISRQTFTLGQTDVPNNPAYFLRWDHTVAGSGSTVRKMRIFMPNVRRSAGKAVTCTIWLKADASRSASCVLKQYFGSGGSPSADVTVVTVAASLTTSWQKITVQGTCASISGKTLGTANDDGLVLDVSLPVNTVMTIDFADCMAAIGSVVETIEDQPSPLLVLTSRMAALNETISSYGAALASMASVIAGFDYLNTKGADITAASTTDLSTTTGYFVNITGNTTINSFGTVNAGIRRKLRFTGTPTITYNGTSMILPGAASITVVAGDSAEFESLGSGNWRCLSYEPVTPPPYALATDAQARAATATGVALTPANLAGAASFRARLGSSQTGLSDATFTKVTPGTEDWDIGGYYDNATNYRWTPPAGRKVVIFGILNVSGTIPAGNQAGAFIYKNGAIAAYGPPAYAVAANNVVSSAMFIDNPNGTDYYELYGFGDVSSGNVTFSNTAGATLFAGWQI